MTQADEYRAKAQTLADKGRLENNPAIQVEFFKLMSCYWKLAELAEQNAKTDIVYEPPLVIGGRQRQAI
jgi:hypothetical protein